MVGGSLTNLSNSINAYSAETGVVAVLSADKATVYLTQDEGHDIILTDLDWADLGNDTLINFKATGMDSRIFDTDGTTEFLSGSAVNVYDKLLMIVVMNQLVLQTQLLFRSSNMQ